MAQYWACPRMFFFMSFLFFFLTLLVFVWLSGFYFYGLRDKSILHDWMIDRHGRDVIHSNTSSLRPPLKHVTGLQIILHSQRFWLFSVSLVWTKQQGPSEWSQSSPLAWLTFLGQRKGTWWLTVAMRKCLDRVLYINTDVYRMERRILGVWTFLSCAVHHSGCHWCLVNVRT